MLSRLASGRARLQIHPQIIKTVEKGGSQIIHPSDLTSKIEAKMSTLTLCRKDEVPEDEGLKIEKHDLSVAVFQFEGNYYVMDDLCSHGPGSLSEGFLDGYEIECDFHAGAFDIRTGEVLRPPCMVPQKTYKVIEHPEDVVIEIP